MARPLYVVIHLYKTAGKALLRNFERNLGKHKLLSMYAPQIGLNKAENSANPGWNEAVVLDYLEKRLNDRIVCLFGHMSFYGVHELPQTKQRDVRYITFLREPITRIVSLYNFLKHNSKNVWHDEIVINNWSLEEWFRYSRGLWLHNGQLRHLLLWKCKEVLELRDLTQEHLRIGKEIINNMWFIGTKETYDVDSRYLCYLLGFKHCQPEEAVNVSTGEKRIDARVRALIEADNALDAELYRHACQVRAAYYERHADDLQRALQGTRRHGLFGLGLHRVRA